MDIEQIVKMEDDREYLKLLLENHCINKKIEDRILKWEKRLCNVGQNEEKLSELVGKAPLLYRGISEAIYVLYKKNNRRKLSC